MIVCVEGAVGATLQRFITYNFGVKVEKMCPTISSGSAVDAIATLIPLALDYQLRAGNSSSSFTRTSLPFWSYEGET